jgi:hypothetical protein
MARSLVRWGVGFEGVVASALPHLPSKQVR